MGGSRAGVPKRKLAPQKVNVWGDGVVSKAFGKKRFQLRDFFHHPQAVSERTDPDYVDRIDRRNADIYFGLLDGIERDGFIKNLPSAERKALLELIHRIEHTVEASSASLTEKRSGEGLHIELATLNKEVVAYLAKHPEKLFEIAPREFEVLIAGILKDMGCEVELTPQTRDKGRDILAVFNTPLGKLLTIVECKRYRQDRPVGASVIERFLWTMKDRDRASLGLIATTSYFSPDAIKIAKEFKYQLKLREFEGIREWLSNYGQWVRKPDCQLWVPST